MNKVFTFQENAVTFQVGATTFVNATEMAKPFGKSPSGFLRLQSTQDFIKTLMQVRQICTTDKRSVMQIYTTDLVKQPKRGQRSGTWMHEDVALEFARWLSPEFGIWCNDRIKEILTGKIQNNDTPLKTPKRRVSSLSLLPASVDNVAELARLEEENRKLKVENDRLRKKVEPTFKITDLAEEFGISVQELCYRLRKANVMAWDQETGKHILHWMLQGYGLTKLVKKVYRYRSGIEKEFTAWEWTEAGRNFVIDLLKGNDTDKYFEKLIDEEQNSDYEEINED